MRCLQQKSGLPQPGQLPHQRSIAFYNTDHPPSNKSMVSWDDFALYHSGDTVWYPGLVQTLQSLGVTGALLPINGRSYGREAEDVVGNLNPEEAALLASQAGVSWWIPMHYETYANNLGDIGAAARETRRRGVPMIIPHYGVPIPLISR